MEPSCKGLGACCSLPSFAYFLKHFPTVISERNGILVCFEYETYLGYIPSWCPSQTRFSFRGCMLCPVVRKQSASALFSSSLPFLPPKEFELCFTLAPCSSSLLSQLYFGFCYRKVLSTADCYWAQIQLRNKPYCAQLLWQRIKVLHGESL